MLKNCVVEEVLNTLLRKGPRFLCNQAKQLRRIRVKAEPENNLISDPLFTLMVRNIKNDLNYDI